MPSMTQQPAAILLYNLIAFEFVSFMSKMLQMLSLVRQNEAMMFQLMVNNFPTAKGKHSCCCSTVKKWAVEIGSGTLESVIEPI